MLLVLTIQKVIIKDLDFYISHKAGSGYVQFILIILLFFRNVFLPSDNYYNTFMILERWFMLR